MKILLVTTDWTSMGGGESCMQIFSHEVEWWDRRREKSSRHIVATHGEEKIWRRTGFLQVWGTVHNKSHLACRARYSLMSLKTNTPHTCSYFKVH